MDVRFWSLGVPLIVNHVIHFDKDKCTMRFNGQFGDNHSNPLPARMTMNGVSTNIMITRKIKGPSTGRCGYESENLKIGRIYKAAESSAPFEPIPEPEPPSQHELDMIVEEKKKKYEEMEIARQKPGFDDMDWYDICYTSTNIIDIEYSII